MKQVVFVLGNGYDLDLGLRSRYCDFAKNKNQEWIDFVNLEGTAIKQIFHVAFIDYLQKAATEKENWFNVEEKIYHFVNENINLNDAQIGLIRLQYDILKKYLRKYLQNESERFKLNENSLALDLSKRLVMSENYIYTLSFNYTDCYDLCRLPKPKGRFLLVHGGLNQNNIELGCREIEDKKRNLQLDFMYKPHINLLSEIFLQNLETASEVIFFGHSLNRMDYCYFKDYFENLEGGRKEDKHLTIICKNLVSENQIKKELAYNGSLSKIEKNIDLQFIYTDDWKEDNPIYHQLCERLNAY